MIVDGSHIVVIVYPLPVMKLSVCVCISERESVFVWGEGSHVFIVAPNRRELSSN